jgi:hypothetical protein
VVVISLRKSGLRELSFGGWCAQKLTFMAFDRSTSDVDAIADIALASADVDPKATLAGCSTTYAFIRNPATSSVLSCLVPGLGESQ